MALRTAGRRASGRRTAHGVLHVVLSLSPGGTERLVVEIIRRLRPVGPMAVCCLDEPGRWGDELRDEGIDVSALGRRPGFHPLIGRDIAAVAARVNTGLLHCHHYSPFVYGCLARAFRTGLQVVFTEHGRLEDGPPSRRRQLANAVLSRLPARVCAVSGDLQRHMVAEGFQAGQVEIVTNGVEPGDLPDAAARSAARTSLGLPPDAFVVGTVGRLDPVKDLPTLFGAFRRMVSSAPAARLVLVGDGAERARLEAMVADWGLGGVHFTGHRSDVRSLMPAFDVYASSSVFEGVSLTILEAMAAGRPVVATRVGGTPEVVVEGETGILVAPRDAEGLARAVLGLQVDGARARAMGLAGRRRLCERFTLDQMVNRYAAAYRELGAL